MVLRPLALSKKAGGLVRPDGFLHRSEADEALVLGDDGARRAEHRGSVGFVFAHGDQPLRRGAYSLDFIVFVGLQAAEEKDFLELQRIGSVGRAYDENFAAKVFDGFYFWLGDEFVLRAFASHDNDDV